MITAKNILICVFFMALSCNRSKRLELVTPSLIEVLSEEERYAREGIPNMNCNSSVFVLTEDGYMLVTDSFDLYHVYLSRYRSHYSTFAVFLEESLNQRLLVKKEYFEEFRSNYFMLNNRIKADYEYLGFDVFYQTYTTRDIHHNVILDKSKLKTLNEIQSILYFLFINQYYETGYDENRSSNPIWICVLKNGTISLIE